MAATSKAFLPEMMQKLRRLFARPINGLSRTGKIARTLKDAAELQSQQRKLYRQVGELAIQMSRKGELKSFEIEKLVLKIEHIERLMNRQEKVLLSIQDKSDISAALKLDEDSNKDRLDPV